MAEQTKGRSLQQAKKFVKAIGDRTLRKELALQSLFFIKLFRSGIDPEEKVKLMAQFFTKNPELNPLDQPDTYGIQQVIGRFAKNKEEAAGARRLYKSMLDGFVKAKANNDSINEVELSQAISEALKEIQQMSITEFNQTVRQMTLALAEQRLKRVAEGVVQDILPGGNGELEKFLGKAQKLLEETGEKARELAEEGDKMVQANIAMNVSVQRRNEGILTVIGMLRSLSAAMASQALSLRKAMP